MIKIFEITCEEPLSHEDANSYSSIIIKHETFLYGPNKISEDPFSR